MAIVYIGTSGFYYKDWLTSFYPKELPREKLLKYYAQYFQTVEINSSFYHLPLKKTVENWKKNTPSNFIFTFKASRYITHIKKLICDQQSIDKLFGVLHPFATEDKRHLILFQLPANLPAHQDRFTTILETIPKGYKYAFEFRHISWFDSSIYKICRKYNVAIVLSDSVIKSGGERTWPYVDVETADFSYIRFHGSQKMYASSYTDEELKHYAEIINHKLQKEMAVYCYFNNDINGHAVMNAQRLKELVAVPA